MDLKKQAVDPGGNRRPGETGDHAPVAARGLPGPSGKLHAVRGIEDDRISHLPQNRKGAEIDHQIIVAEADPPLGQHEVVVARRRGFLQDMGGIPGGKELPLLDIHGPRLAGDFDDEIGLPAEKGRNLQDIEDPGGRFDLLEAMDVGENGDIELLPDLLENLEPPDQTGPPVGIPGGPVRLVVGGLEDERDLRVSRSAPSDNAAISIVFSSSSMTHGPAISARGAPPPISKPADTDGFHERIGLLHSFCFCWMIRIFIWGIFRAAFVASGFSS